MASLPDARPIHCGALPGTAHVREDLDRSAAAILRRRIAGPIGRSGHLILLCGRCRVGSTALAHLFSRAGAASFYQPIKTILRHLMLDMPFDEPLRLNGQGGLIVLKETFGPFTEIESGFDPLAILLDAGWPAEQITVLGLEREPVACYDSWIDLWGGRVERATLLANYLRAARQNDHVRATAQARGIRFLRYHYEWSRDRTAALGYLERALGLGTGRLLSADDAPEGASPSMLYLREPDAFFTDGAHRPMDRYVYRPRAIRHVTAPERARIQRLDLTTDPPPPRT